MEKKKEDQQIDDLIGSIEKNLRIGKDEKRRLRREFRLRRIEEKTKLMVAKGNRWKWLAAVLGLGIVAYMVFKFVG